ncbi:hypothetical protein [Kiloniella antarctica]|uniref:Uncharacterized protein n=1 Tax=Kiloniella antarctica TaxID=1550907 RepID=A0ABW5BIW7_9PROT
MTDNDIIYQIRVSVRDKLGEEEERDIVLTKSMLFDILSMVLKDSALVKEIYDYQIITEKLIADGALNSPSFPPYKNKVSSFLSDYDEVEKQVLLNVITYEVSKVVYSEKHVFLKD